MSSRFRKGILIVSHSVLLMGLFGTAAAVAQDATVINVKKNIALADTDVPLRDYYVNIGGNHGLKKGQILKVERKALVRDSSGALSFGEIRVPVGELQVLSVYPKVSVARELKIYPRDEFPILDQIGILVGDVVLKSK